MLCMHAQLQWLGVGDRACTPPALLPHAVGSLYLFDSLVTDNFKEDGYQWGDDHKIKLPAGA